MNEDLLTYIQGFLTPERVGKFKEVSSTRTRHITVVTEGLSHLHNTSAVIRSCDDEVDVLMVFGHNNAMTNLVNHYGDMEIDNVSTAAFTAIEFDTDRWSMIKKGKTIHFIKPKDLK